MMNSTDFINGVHAVSPDSKSLIRPDTRYGDHSCDHGSGAHTPCKCANCAVPRWDHERVVLPSSLLHPCLPPLSSIWVRTPPQPRPRCVYGSIPKMVGVWYVRACLSACMYCTTTTSTYAIAACRYCHTAVCRINITFLRTRTHPRSSSLEPLGGLESCLEPHPTDSAVLISR